MYVDCNNQRQNALQTHVAHLLTSASYPFRGTWGTDWRTPGVSVLDSSFQQLLVILTGLVASVFLCQVYRGRPLSCLSSGFRVSLSGCVASSRW